MSSEREYLARKNGVGVGMVIAAALVADDDPVKAEEILQAAGMTTAAQMRSKGVDDYDIGKLRTVLRDIASRERNLSARKATPPAGSTQIGEAK